VRIIHHTIPENKLVNDAVVNQQVNHTCNEACCIFTRLSWLRTDSSSALSESTTCFKLWAWLVAESTPCWLSCTSCSSRSIWQSPVTTTHLLVITDFYSFLQTYCQ